jgi:hypothetical protein
LGKKLVVLFLLRIIKIAIRILNPSFSANYFGGAINRNVLNLTLNSKIIMNTALWGLVNENFQGRFILIHELWNVHACMFAILRREKDRDFKKLTIFINHNGSI